MRINIYSEEITPRIEVVHKEAEGRRFIGMRFYLLSHPGMHPPLHGDDDTSAITFWQEGGTGMLELLIAGAQDELRALNAARGGEG